MASTTQTELSISAANQPIRRQPRGSINRRACQKCRHLKIKCDGDAERNISCSNCDYGMCVYDKSPRKNRQVERLNSKVENLEKTLMETQENMKIISDNCVKKSNDIEILKLEKQVLNLLFDCHSHFVDHPVTFRQLRQVINESRCWSIYLELTQALLLKLSQNEGNNTNSIISTLKTIAESCISCCNQEDAFNPNAPPQNIIDEMNISNNQIFINTAPTVTAGLENLALHSPGSDAGSEMSNLNLPDFKLDLTSSPLLAPTPTNIEMNSPHLTPTMDEVTYFSGSDYGSSPVQTSTEFPYGSHQYLDEGFFYLDVESSYGSNSSNNGQ
ncbi:hypothetical protein RclHR1_03240016 [Rhizophagus clarus]|uniref:Zn(2)-C6 fungal-type domain-containing protein n=1 Tax=Rhizophagus clarus TaxID=94130 RepID=A0A2Z6RPK9_9GLOM|nr:hypothetical protein RclHR1_03240016 [Rhizophagus clarus]GES74871.1 hypothetical protein GLOIN_2v1571975 [Rhizophagus clarus]